MASRSQQRNGMRLDILHALERCLEAGATYTEVSIPDICREAHISKPTFYRYFQSKDNVVRWLVKLALQCGVCEIGRTYSWYEGYRRTSMAQYQHRAFYCDKQSPALISNLMDFSTRFQHDNLVETLTKHHGVVVDERIMFQIDALMLAEGFMARHWAEGGMQTPPHVIAEYLASVVPHDLFKLLNEPRQRIDGTNDEESPRTESLFLFT